MTRGSAIASTPHVVLLINSLGGGGAERVTATLANYFAEAHGFATTILTLEPQAPAYALSRGVTHRFLVGGRLARGAAKVLLLPFLAASLARALRELQPTCTISFLVRSNLVHVLSRLFGNCGRIVISERCDTQAAYADNSVGSRIMLALVRRVYRRADHIVAISQGVKASLVRLGIAPEKVTVIYNPQSLALIEERRRAHEGSGGASPDRPFTLVSVGRLTQQKDVPTLLAALGRLRKRGRTVRAVIVGEGPDEPVLRGLAQRLGVGTAVEWTGWLPDPFPTMLNADVFIFTSRYEGFGNVLVEAMACGLPVISTDCDSGPAEILEDGRFGILVPVGDSNKLADAIEHLLDHPEDRARFRAIGLDRSVDFDVASIGAQYLEVLGCARPTERADLEHRAREAV